MTGAEPDTRPAIVKFVEKVNRAAGQDPAARPSLGAKIAAAQPLPALGAADRARLVAAARLATDRHPGPLGELIDREIQAFLDFGHRFDDGTGLARRLADHLLGMDAGLRGSGTRA